MPSHTIFDPQKLEVEIRQSHMRSREHGIDPNEYITPNHIHVSREARYQRQREHPEFFEIASQQMEELYRLYAGADDFDGTPQYRVHYHHPHNDDDRHCCGKCDQAFPSDPAFHRWPPPQPESF
jgi:hypothetical protein